MRNEALNVLCSNFPGPRCTSPVFASLVKLVYSISKFHREKKRTREFFSLVYKLAMKEEEESECRDRLRALVELKEKSPEVYSDGTRFPPKCSMVREYLPRFPKQSILMWVYHTWSIWAMEQWNTLRKTMPRGSGLAWQMPAGLR